MSEFRENLTLKDIAVLVNPNDLSGAKDRIRYWTRVGIVPVGEINPGTGHHRRYDSRSVDWAITLEKMRTAGIKIPNHLQQQVAHRCLIDPAFGDALSKVSEAVEFARHTFDRHKMERLLDRFEAEDPEVEDVDHD